MSESQFLEMIGTMLSREQKEKLYEAGWGGGVKAILGRVEKV